MHGLARLPAEEAVLVISVVSLSVIVDGARDDRAT